MTQRARIAGGVLASALLALVLMLALGGGIPARAPIGLPDPGRFTAWALPIATFTVIALGVLVVGSLLVPMLTVTGEGGDDIRGRAVRAIAAVRRLAPVWALVALLELVLTYSDQFAVPVWQARPGDVYGFAVQVDQGRALVVQALLALAVAVAARYVTRAPEAGWVLVLALAAFAPPVLTGHAASSGSHDTAIISLLLHVAAVAVWLGGLVALWWYLGERPRTQQVAARRFSALAAWCFGVVAVSGLINALVRLGGLSEFVTTDYGRGVLVKVALLALIALLARRVRSALIGGGLRSVALITGAELAAMSAAVGLGVALSRTPPPVGTVYTSVAEDLLGGPLPPAPTVGRLLWSFTPSGVGLAVVLLGGAAYLAGVVHLRRQGDTWPIGRTIAWFVGLLTVGYATFGGLGTYSHVMFSAHMASHMVLSMVAPILLVLGAPVNLALRALPGTDADGGRGPRQWLAAVLRTRYVRFLTHPVVAALIFVGSLYGIYFSGAFEGLMESHLGHAFMEVHFLLAGCLYFEVLVGDSPLPHRIGHFARLGLLLVVMPFHAFFAIAVMNSETAIGGRYYSLLDRPYATDLLHDQFVGGSLTWAAGEVPMVLVLFVLLGQWYLSDSREARRYDRKADRDQGADLEAYNRMFAALAERDDAR
ncbi:cytochrome c oxidase assembly protein [Nocardioides fonticola]|uniref:Cytochrome c oxidase assembly protein n=1 Tax=Nocardioides fonticola TaxID=450363 RepID=A0ABP7XAE6_9ACTN